MSDNRADCIGGGYTYAAHGDNVVLLAFSPEVGWWRNSVAFTPEHARKIAAVLVEQARHAEEMAAPDDDRSATCDGDGSPWPFAPCPLDQRCQVDSAGIHDPFCAGASGSGRSGS